MRIHRPLVCIPHDQFGRLRKTLSTAVDAVARHAWYCNRNKIRSSVILSLHAEPAQGTKVDLRARGRGLNIVQIPIRPSDGPDRTRPRPGERGGTAARQASRVVAGSSRVRATGSIRTRRCCGASRRESMLVTNPPPGSLGPARTSCLYCDIPPKSPVAYWRGVGFAGPTPDSVASPPICRIWAVCPVNWMIAGELSRHDSEADQDHLCEDQNCCYATSLSMCKLTDNHDPLRGGTTGEAVSQ